ncbi:MAG: N-6 DNA methylase [Planctomycetaceae bacterium]|nr:N-6 DNA methylase [Planctomycetaceae bacterium]
MPSSGLPNTAIEADVAAHMRALESATAEGGVSQRRAQGAHYTPAWLVEHVVGEALRGWRPSGEGWRLIDPACGSGNFLVAAARAASHAASEPIEVVLERRVYGVDIDAEAVRLARESLKALVPRSASAEVRARIARAIDEHVIVHDALSASLEAAIGTAPFDLVVGNPPFLNQLERGTAASRQRASDIAALTDGAVRRYADIAAAFLVTGARRLSRGGRLGFVMPLSFLAANDARGARDAVLASCELRALWSCRSSPFAEADVRVCAVVLERGGGRGLRRSFGESCDALAPRDFGPARGDISWAPWISDGFGVPAIAPSAGAPISTIASATADFRDQYYGLRGAIVRDGDLKLVTTRHVDLAACSWESAEVRVLGERFVRPMVSLAALASEPEMLRWAAARRVPKVLVSTQTRVMEAWVDERGESLPLVPLLTVTPHDGVSLWMAAAAVASPVVAVRAAQLYAGAAMDAMAIKLSAKQLLAMPCPVDHDAWRESAARFERASRASSVATRAAELRAFAESSCHAHALPTSEAGEVLAFWNSRARLS